MFVDKLHYDLFWMKLMWYIAVLAGRGIWKEKPSDWDAEIPFCDPNNAEHPHIDQRKPSKKTLATMMKYLVYKFEVQNFSNEKH